MTMGDRIKTRQQLLDEQADAARTPATVSNIGSKNGNMVKMTTRQQDPRRLDQDHADARTLQEAAASLRSETKQAQYTNRNLDPYPLFTLAELLDILAREVRIGELHPRNAVRRGALDLARQLQRKVGPSVV